MTEKELIRGCIREDKSCQKALFLQYAGKMLTICRRYARHQAEAEDMLQDSFVKIFANLNQFNFQGSFEGWIRRIVVNNALKNIKKSSFKNEQIGVETLPEKSTEPIVFAQLNEEVLLNLIKELPEGYRFVFNLYAIEGFSHQEIAEQLGIEASTSRSQLVKARKLLQNKIISLREKSI